METTLKQIDNALTCFHQDQVIFKTLGVCKKDGLSLPWQHSLVHYKETIQLFGSLNGLCSSITELMHIRAVKEPWHRANKYGPLGQMLVINQRLAKVATLQSFLEKHGLLDGALLLAFMEEIMVGNMMMGHDNDHQIVHGPSCQVDHEVYLAKTWGALVYNACIFRILMPDLYSSPRLSQLCKLTCRKDQYSQPSPPRWQVPLLTDEPRLLRSFVNFVTQGYKGTVGSSREFQHLMTKEV